MESFIDFIETKGETAEEITQLILNKIESDGLDIQNCRGQSYDNAAVMAGRHTGVQARIKEMNLKAEFVACSNHSLNLHMQLLFLRVHLLPMGSSNFCYEPKYKACYRN